MTVKRTIKPVEKNTMTVEYIKNLARSPSISSPRSSISRHERSKSQHESSSKWPDFAWQWIERFYKTAVWSVKPNDLAINKQQAMTKNLTSLNNA